MDPTHTVKFDDVLGQLGFGFETSLKFRGGLFEGRIDGITGNTSNGLVRRILHAQGPGIQGIPEDFARSIASIILLNTLGGEDPKTIVELRGVGATSKVVLKVPDMMLDATVTTVPPSSIGDFINSNRTVFGPPEPLSKCRAIWRR